MKYCPKCSQEYQDDKKTCPDCGNAKLVASLEDAGAVKYYDRESPDVDYSELAIVFEGTLFQAELVHGRLEVEDIPSFIDGGEIAQMVGLPVDESRMDFIRVLVHPDNLKAAKKFIEDAKSVTEEELTKAAMKAGEEEE